MMPENNYVLFDIITVEKVEMDRNKLDGSGMLYIRPAKDSLKNEVRQQVAPTQSSGRINVDRPVNSYMPAQKVEIPTRAATSPSTQTSPPAPAVPVAPIAPMPNVPINNISQPQKEQTQKDEYEPRKRSKAVFAFLIIAVVLIIGGGVAFWLLNSGDFKWKEAYGDIGLEYVTQTKIKLDIDANDNILEGISYSGFCDRNENIKQPERDESGIVWDLSDGVGKCTIKAQRNLKVIEKSFIVVPKELEYEDLGLEDIYRVNIGSDNDEDGDGLINKREKALKTKIDLTDTDGDGLSDGYEVDTLKTDPLKADTDNDGLNDASEIKMNMNPLKEDSKGDGVKDGDRTTSYVYKDNGVTVSISGTGNIANVTIDTTNGAALSKKTGLIPRLYSFYADGKVNDVTVSISYTDTELINAKISENDLVLYKYAMNDNKYVAIDTKINKAAKTISAKLDDLSSYYVVGSKKSSNLDSVDSEILFVLDNSWSMYTNEQYKKMKGADYPKQLEGNDPEGRRYKLTKELIKKLDSKGAKVGISEFSGDYVTVEKIGSKLDTMEKTLDGMNEHQYIKQAGTNITNGIRSGAREFSAKASLKTLILLTDGQDNGNLAQQVEALTNEMVNQNVRICVLGFGEGAYSNDLSIITARTGCRYFSSTDVSGLDEIFKNLEILLNDELADIDGDGKMDGYVMADNGFIVTRDGFSFKNYSSNLMTDGHCYGMATFAQLYYAKKMPLRHDAIKNAGLSSSAYNLNWSYFKDYENLYDYKLKTNALKYVPQFGFDYFGEQKPANMYTVNNGVIGYTEDMRSKINETGLYEFYNDKPSHKSDAQIQRYGFSYSSMTKARLSETKMQNSATIDDVDRSLFNAIYASQIRQTTVKMYSSGSAIGIDSTVVNNSTKHMTNSNDFISLLSSRIARHEVPVILAYFSGGLHAMNAINLVQDAKNSNHYYIGVYDSSYPGEKRYLELSCSKYSCTTKANSYYGESGEVIRMSISQDEDLKHFE